MKWCATPVLPPEVILVFVVQVANNKLVLKDMVMLEHINGRTAPNDEISDV